MTADRGGGGTDGAARAGLRLLLLVFCIDEDHPVLAWQAAVARRLGERVERLVVLADKIGNHAPFESNTRIAAFPGKVLGIPHRLGARFLLNPFVFRLCREERIERVLIHMAHKWAYSLYPAFAALRLPVTTWYAHGTVSPSLKLAVAASDRMLTSSPEGCRVPSRKVVSIGQAIDTSLFLPGNAASRERVVYVGRISERKRVHAIYEVARCVVRQGTGISGFDIVGAPLTRDDLAYCNALQMRVWRDGMERCFRFHGVVPQARIGEFYERAFLHLNLSHTGSLDKTVMEALACGCPVLTTNPPFKDLLKEWPWMYMDDEEVPAVAAKVIEAFKDPSRVPGERLRELIESRHSMATYPDRVLANLGAP